MTPHDPPTDASGRRLPLGPTGKFPDGRRDDEDLGEIDVALAADRQRQLVRIDFGCPVRWLALPPANAVAFARLILAKAAQLDPAS